MAQAREWVSFRPNKTKKKGSSTQPLREKIVGELKEKAELGYLGIPKNLGSSGYVVGD